MGSLTHFTAIHYNFIPPSWLVERWDRFVSFGEVISSRAGMKGWSEFETDLQRAMKEQWVKGNEPRAVMAYLHECGNVTRSDLRIDEIHYSSPVSWIEVPHVAPHEAWDSCANRPWPWKPTRSIDAPS